jgi:hypothetical protein
MRPTPDCLYRRCLTAPKGQQDSAQGFNPGYDILKRCALKGHKRRLGEFNGRLQSAARTHSGATREAVLQKCLVRIAPRDREVGDAFRAHPITLRYPGLKPWAKSLCPFGAKDDEDSLSDEACFPLQRPRLVIRRSRKDERRGAGNP